MAFWRPKKTEDLNALLEEVEQAEEGEASEDLESPPIPQPANLSPSSIAIDKSASVSDANDNANANAKAGRGGGSGASSSLSSSAPSSAVEVTDMTVELSYGIERAIELLRELPNRNIDLVMSVVAKTLESANIDVASLIESAEERNGALDAAIGDLRGDIADLEESIRLKKRKILELEEKQREVRMVRERLSLARGERISGMDGPLRRPGSLTGSSPVVVPSALPARSVSSASANVGATNPNVSPNASEDMGTTTQASTNPSSPPSSTPALHASMPPAPPPPTGDLSDDEVDSEADASDSDDR
ncbi:MAG: hypothetical protein H6729_10745 [Deltaproteobacteria bacterium]|nr:hypothetical protein [Deltaproteobacteria bacterium]